VDVRRDDGLAEGETGHDDVSRSYIVVGEIGIRHGVAELFRE
jgi:hypothetical protein